MRSAVLVLLILAAMVACSEALTCPCWSQNPRVCTEPTGCKGGLTMDMCGCCQECAKVLDEECAGAFGFKGRCDAKLKCNNDAKDFNASGHCVADTEEIVSSADPNPGHE